MPIITHLEKQYYCIAFDLPYHGNSQTCKFKDPLAVEENLLRTVKGLTARPPTFFGYSMGGRIAIHLSIKTSKSSLVLISSSIERLLNEKLKTRKAFENHLKKELHQESFIKFLDQWYSSPLFSTLRKKPKVYESMLKLRLKESPEHLVKALDLFSPTHYLPPNLSKTPLNNPVLYLYGSCDYKYKLMAQEFQKHQKNVRLASIEQSSHALHLEQPENIAQLTHQFYRYNYDRMEDKTNI